MTSELSGKAAPKAFASTKPLLGKFSVSGLAKKTNSAAEVESKSAKEPLKSEGNLLFGFRADTKSFTAKKRKSRTSTSALDETKHDFPNKSSRTGGKSGFAFMARNKEKGTEISPNVEPSFSRVKKTSSVATKASECTMSKKRGLLLSSADASLALKRLKPMAQTGETDVMSFMVMMHWESLVLCHKIPGQSKFPRVTLMACSQA
ncbi:Laminin subunit alpha-1-like [Phytophthora palmivora]|uniref:Laminin subunit alpha-1-like n=1 Tax=Phytophthora palmivora TaxID=4796 RepID=A0A2P4YAA9_9STRA|nr:Laminin subunit alpha-1-like [Phytophthora palmivora]